MTLGTCQVCERENLPVEKHHLSPSKRYKTITVCEACGDQIHVLFTNVELSQRYNTLAKLKATPQIKKFVKWLRKHRSGSAKRVKVRESRKVKRWRRG